MKTAKIGATGATVLENGSFGLSSRPLTSKNKIKQIIEISNQSIFESRKFESA